MNANEFSIKFSRIASKVSGLWFQLLLFLTFFWGEREGDGFTQPNYTSFSSKHLPKCNWLHFSGCIFHLVPIKFHWTKQLSWGGRGKRLILISDATARGPLGHFCFCSFQWLVIKSNRHISKRLSIARQIIVISRVETLGYKHWSDWYIH